MSDTTNQDNTLSTSRFISAFSTAGRVITPLEFKVASDAQLFIDQKVFYRQMGASQLQRYSVTLPESLTKAL